MHVRISRLLGAVAFVSFSMLAIARVEDFPSNGSQPSVTTPQGREITLYDESHALLISAGAYPGKASGGWPPLESVQAEMDLVSDVLRRHGFSIRRVYDPTGDELQQNLRRFMAQYGHIRNSRFLVFFSGHGYTNPSNNFGYLVPVDARNPETNLTDFLSKALPIRDLDSDAREIEAKHALFVFDSCFSGAIFASKGLNEKPQGLVIAPSDRWRFLTGQAEEPLRQFIAAGGANEQLPARSDFIPMFVHALAHGIPSSPDEFVTSKEMGLWIEQNLPTLTGGHQRPHSDVIRDPSLAFGDMIFHIERRDTSALPIPVTVRQTSTASTSGTKALALPSCQPATKKIQKTIAENNRLVLDLAATFGIPESCKISKATAAKAELGTVSIDKENVLTYEPEGVGTANLNVIAFLARSDGETEAHALGLDIQITPIKRTGPQSVK